MKYTLDELTHLKGTSEPVRVMMQAQAEEIERLRAVVHQAQDALEELQKGRTFKSKHLAVAAINKCKEMK